MTCSTNPQGFYTANPATSGVQPVQNNAYVAAGEWGEPIAVDPNNPSSPLSVQPNGRGTPFVGTTTLPGTVDTAVTLPGNLETAVTLPGNVNTSVAVPLPETLTQPIYTPGYLHQYLGRLMRVEFLIGNQTTDRVGYLREVGASYIVLESVDYGNLMMCDLYAIKFATILRSPMDSQIASLYEEQ